MLYILFYRIKKQVKLNALLFRNKKPHEKTFKNAGGGFWEQGGRVDLARGTQIWEHHDRF